MSSSAVFDKEKILGDARSKLYSLYEKFVKEIEEEADRVLRERIASLEPIKKELLEKLKSVS
jgi:F0F1-type ATP synthase membrane subunit b/b'